MLPSLNALKKSATRPSFDSANCSMASRRSFRSLLAKRKSELRSCASSAKAVRPNAAITIIRPKS